MYTFTVEAEEGRGPRYGDGRLARRRAAFATAGYLRHGFSDFKFLPFPPASYLRAVACELSYSSVRGHSCRLSFIFRAFIAVIISHFLYNSVSFCTEVDVFEHNNVMQFRRYV